MRNSLRRLLRAQRTVFPNDDGMQKVALNAIREQFRNHARLTDADEVAQKLREADEAASFLEKNIVQTKLNEKGNYEIGHAALEMHPSRN